jgi:hypothetical protein
MSDVVAAMTRSQRVTLRRRSALVAPIVMCVIAVLFGGVFFAITSAMGDGVGSMRWMFLGVVVLILAMAGFIAVRTVRTRLVLDENGITVHNGFGHQTIAWSEVQNAVIEQRTVFIRHSNSSRVTPQQIAQLKINGPSGPWVEAARATLGGHVHILRDFISALRERGVPVWDVTTGTAQPL